MSPRDRASLALTTAIGMAIAALAGRTTFALWRFATAAPELPLWDEAKYGLDGARLAAALADLNLVRFAALVYDLDVWPPLFPLAESVVFLAAGNQVAVARGLVATLFFLLALAAFWAGREIAPASPAVAAIAAVLVVSSPFAQLFATQAMLEVPGALLYLLSLAAYARFLRTGERRALIATGVATAALFFTKYNYGLLWIAPLLLHEAWVACGGPRALLDRALSLARRVDLRRPFTAFVVLYGAVLAAVALTGGGTLRLGGTSLSVRSIGNPLFVLVVILVARAMWRPRRALERWRRWESALAERHRVLLWTIAIPVAIWLVLPPHLRSFVDFVENRSSGPPLASAASFLFHPRVFVETYHAAPLVGVAVLLAAVTALFRVGRAAPAERVLLLAVAAGLAATTLHPYKEARFFFVAAPVVWLAAAWNATTVAEAAFARLRMARLGTNAAVAAAALLLAVRIPAVTPGHDEAFARYTVPASTGPILDRVVALATERPTLVLGTWNQLSPSLVEWRFRQRHAAAAPPELPVPSRRGGSAERLLRALREAEPPEQIVFVSLAEDGAPSAEWGTAFAEETAWLQPLLLELESGALNYAGALDESFPGAGYRVRVFRAPAPEGRRGRRVARPLHTGS